VRAARRPLEIFWTPHAKPGSLIDFDRGIKNDGGWRITIVERGGINKRLKRRARLPHGLGRTVELGLIEGESADHRKYPAGVGVHPENCAEDLGNRAQPVLTGFPVYLPDINHVARSERCARAGAAAPAKPSREKRAGHPFALDLAGFLVMGLQANVRARCVDI